MTVHLSEVPGQACGILGGVFAVIRGNVWRTKAVARRILIRIAMPQFSSFCISNFFEIIGYFLFFNSSQMVAVTVTEVYNPID